MTRLHSRRTAITLQTALTDQLALAQTPRARGQVRVVTKRGSRGTVLRDLHQAGSAKVVFPRAATGFQAVTVNTAGGITGGDRFEYTFEAAKGTRMSVTTQAAERAYGSQQGETGRLDTTLTVGTGARIDWVPQETILFDRCRFGRTMRINLAADASLLFAEPLVFGRVAMGETMTDIAFGDRVEIWRDGVPLFVDAMALNGDVDAHLRDVAGGAGALASVVYVASDAPAHLDAIRAVLPETAGASLIGEDLLHIRFLAHDSFDLRTALVPVLDRLTQNTLPRVWMI